MSQCRGCGREIIWLRMKSGKHMPVDPEPVFVAEGGKDAFITDEGERITGTASETDTGTVGFGAALGHVPGGGAVQKARITWRTGHWKTCGRACWTGRCGSGTTALTSLLTAWRPRTCWLSP